MFPTVRWPSLVKLHCFIMLLTGVVAFNLSPIQSTLTQTTNQDQLTQLQAVESHLQSKAERVVDRITDQPFTIDLSVALDSTRTTTTSLGPDPWERRVDHHPRILSIMCCVTIEGSDPSLDTDHLFRRLSYTLGLDLSRGDLLRIVTR